MPGLGHKSYLAFIPETTYGSYLAPTKKIEIISWNVTPQIGIIDDASLNAKQSRRGIYPGSLYYSGTFVCRMNFVGMEELFRGVFGTYTKINPIGGDAAVIDHEFRSDGTPNLKSFSMEIIMGDVPTGKTWHVLGAKLVGLTVRGTAGNGNDAMLTAEFNVLAKDIQTGTTALFDPATLTDPPVFPVLYHSFGETIIADDGVTTDGSNRIRSFEVTLTVPHTEDRFYLGSKNFDEPVRSDFLEATWRLTQEFQTVGQFTAATTGATGSPQLTFTNPTVIGSAKKRTFEMRSGSAILTEYSSPIEGYGILISTATWRAFYDATDTCAIYARFRNLNSEAPALAP